MSPDSASLPMIGAPQVTLDAQAFAAFRTLVHERAGIAIRDGKESLVAARVSKRMRELNLDVVGDYIAHIKADRSGDEMVRLLDAISTNTTSFFREPKAFTAMEEHLTAQLARGERTIRIWCAASSSGEEPYTIAMVLMRVLDKARIAPESVDAAILATDISTRVLAQARAGLYHERVMVGVPDDLRRRWFTAAGDSWQVSEELRRLITFNRLNLSKPPFPMHGPLDLVFCRNVMIYFDTPVRTRLVAAIHRLLRPGGMLVIGSAESLAGLQHDYKTLRPSTFQKSH